MAPFHIPAALSSADSVRVRGVSLSFRLLTGLFGMTLAEVDTFGSTGIGAFGAIGDSLDGRAAEPVTSIGCNGTES